MHIIVSKSVKWAQGEEYLDIVLQMSNDLMTINGSELLFKKL